MASKSKRTSQIEPRASPKEAEFTVRKQINVAIDAQMQAYIDPVVFRKVFTDGDLVSITKDGMLCGYAEIQPLSKPTLDPAQIQLSPVLREQCDILTGDRVAISKFAFPESVVSEVLVYVDGLSNPEVEQSVRSLFSTLKYICKGYKYALEDSGSVHVCDILTKQNEAVSLYGAAEPGDTEAQIFSVPEVYTLTFADSTESRLKSPFEVTYDSIGGLDKEISMLRMFVDLPLNRPEIFAHFGVPAVRGVLLHGPPGTGKTMLLRAVASETKARLITINGPSIISKYLGESEAALRKRFEEAHNNQPAIIFLDEIDALAPRRDDDDSGQAEARLVGTLLTLMDGTASSSTSRVVVIGATNRPNSIDPALRRPGRFDKEIEVGIPDAAARLDIMRILLSKIPHDLHEDDIEHLAGKTHGYVGADLSSLCQEAALSSIERNDDIIQDKTSDEYLNLRVTLSDFQAAINKVRPSAMREIFLEPPTTRFSEIGGQEEVKQKLREMVEWPLTKSDTFQRLGIQAPKGILLYGPPGCSKTLVAKALATEAGLNFFAVKGPELFNKFVGESEKSVRDLFRKARAVRPSIIFFDEIDAMASSRETHSSGADRILTTLLNEMDGIESLDGVVVLAASNRPEVIDSALLRPGRIDRLVYVSPPDREARTKIFEITLAKMSVADDVTAERLADKADRMSGAEIVAACQEAGLQAMNENIDALCIEWRHFESALLKARRGITDEMIEFYEQFRRSTTL
ncbi:hypothetical protein CANCADRAFT_30202 [Tortispora caseinolytica NRRL Y-17796]|uniref:AAA+ ATPase domain-containing protein n=1 Tax=Tortispora caseinolytica NRRL Y-17796 TaxID=767744 RepID=A0A1E4TJI8_9ASCO|nr:hypothetical protein CANCADRAFT_30202 [Tortispora caseinolytica NRRL Y-17796]